MSDRIASALGLACCAGLGFMAAVALADPAITVTDGDSLRVNGERVRLFGIDAPELKQRCASGHLLTSDPPQEGYYACGEASAAHLRRLVEADPAVTCARLNTDKYGRAVAICTSSVGDLGRRQVIAGWATDYARYSGGRYRDEEAAARSEKLGMHAGSFTPPEQYRRDKR